MPMCDLLQRNFIEIALWHGCSPVNLLHIFRAPFSKNTSGRRLLHILQIVNNLYQQMVLRQVFQVLPVVCHKDLFCGPYDFYETLMIFK